MLAALPPITTHDSNHTTYIVGANGDAGQLGAAFIAFMIARLLPIPACRVGFMVTFLYCTRNSAIAFIRYNDNTNRRDCDINS